VLALVRPHHIYGFLLSVALPARLGVPVIDLAGVPDGLDAAAARLTADGAGTLVVAAPPQWRYLAAVLPDRPTHAVGVSSTGALDPAVADRLVAGPLQALIEIFGSTETAGLGTRRHPETAFTLFDHWARDPSDPDRLHHAPGAPGGAADPVALPDRLDWLDTRRFCPAGRHDRQVSIGGTQVSPQAVARRLAERPGVAAARVRPHGPSHALRLKALVVPRDGADVDRLRPDLADFIRTALPPAERPVDLVIAPEVPVDASGKETDWPIRAREGVP
jgi:4-coumarate--CoA ligase (photoactive yellow protein activation family)